MFEGIAGAIRSRWYERLWRGCDHFAVEVHWLPDRSIRFTIAAPRYLGPAIKGPLEDLYPDVELVGTDGAAHLGADSRAAQEEPPVRPVDPDQPQLRARVHRVARRAAVSPRPRDDRPARPHAGARVRAPASATDAQEPRARRSSTPITATPASSASTPSSKPRSSRARSSCSTARCCTSTCASSGATRRPSDASPASSRNCDPRTTSARATSELRRRLYARRTELALPNPLPGLRTGVLSTSELATLWQLPRAPREARAHAAGDRSPGDRARPRSSATPNVSCLRTSAGRSRSPPPTASTGMP